MYFDIGPNTIIYVSSGIVNINKNVNLPVGQSISWGSNYSRIYDDSQLHIYTDDNMYFDIGASNAITLNNNRVEINKDIITPSFDAVSGGSLLNTPPFTKSSRIISTFNVSANYKKEITINTPISSYNTGLFSNGTATFYNILNGINCYIYNSNNELVSTPSVISTNGIGISKSVTVYNDYEQPTFLYEQYFTNAFVKFKPTFKSSSDTYKVELIIQGSGDWKINTNISSRSYNSSYIIFNDTDNIGYISPNYSETIYATLGKTGCIEANEFYSNKITCDNINKTVLGYFNYNQNGGTVYNYTFPMTGLYLVTTGLII